MESQKSIHFNGLNGIRAICAMVVIISHSSLSLSLAGLKAGPVFELGAYGVTVFFALSGFLITYLLIQEKEFKGDISVNKFYIRRLLRIWPLYFGYMLIALLTNIFFFPKTDFSSIAFYLFFVPNIPFAYEIVGMKTYTTIYLLGHFWSLGVEEQFYAFYPWLIKLFKKNFVVIVCMFLIVVLLKLTGKFISAKTGNPFWYSLADNTRFDAMAIGGMGAWLYHNNFALVLRVVKSWLIQILVSLIIILVLLNVLKIPNTLSHMIIALITVIGIYYAHLLDKPLINLRNSKIDYLGKISFGLYVYHPLAIAISGVLIKTILTGLPSVKIMLFIFLVLLVTIILASLSYQYFEKYFLKLKIRYAVVKSKD